MMDDSKVDIINLKKIIPKVFDERLPYRGFLKGEVDNISSLWINGKNIKIEDLPNSTEFGVVFKYTNKDGKEIVPQITGDEVSISEPELINKAAKLKLSKADMTPQEWEWDEYSMGEHYHGRQLVINTEVKKDSFGRFRYTKVLFKSSATLNQKDQFSRAISSINRLIDIYRVETSDYWVSNITENDILIYKIVSDNDTQMQYSTQGFTRIKKDKDAEAVEQIRRQLTNPEPQHPYMMLILDAQKSVDEGKNYLSVIYSITALESLVRVYILFYARKNGLGEKDENNLSSQRLYFLVTKELKKFVKSTEFTEELINKISEGITLRNKIIHEYRLEVSAEEAKIVLTNVKTLVRVLSEDIGNQ